jgi:hypothetical protein
MKLFKYLTLKVFIKDPIIAAKVFQVLYQGDKVMVNTSEYNNSNTLETKPTITQTPSNDAHSALRELKSKTFKTKKDKEAIEVLEAVIKNGY